MKDKSEIVCILDRSGSMASIIEDAIGGYNTFLKDQKKIDKPANLTVVQFDDHYETHYDGDLKTAPEMTPKTYVPRGMTALLDAIGKTINAVGFRLSNLAEDQRPSQVMFVIITDGMENASREFTRQQINEMITHQREKYSWEFVFLAANQDAITEAGKIGIQGHFAVNYAATPRSAKGAYAVMSRAVSDARVHGLADIQASLDCDIDEDGNVSKRDSSNTSS